MVRIPITRPMSGGMAGGEKGGGLPPNHAPLSQVNGIGVPPTLETLRATERLVAAVAAENTGGDGPYSLGPGDEAGDQYTEGLGKSAMSAQQAWAAKSAGAARQAEVLGAVAAHSAQLYRAALEQM